MSALYQWQELLYRAALEQQGRKDKDDAFCAGCHAPSAEGVACLTCHRMAAVADGLEPHPAKRITWGEENVMLGPIGDATDALVHGTKRSDIHEDERVCLACHDHDVATDVPCCTVVREWRASEIREYMTCQSCHMRGVKNQAVARGGPSRTLHRHNFPAAGDLDQMRGGWELEFGRVGGGTVEVIVTNRSGHSLPNGEPYGTRVVLRVNARDVSDAVVGAAERSFGFDMLDGDGRATMFVHEALRRGSSTALASGEARSVIVNLPAAARYTATLGYAVFDPPEEAWLRVNELRQWIERNHSDLARTLMRLEGKVRALGRAREFLRVEWPK